MKLPLVLASALTLLPALAPAVHSGNDDAPPPVPPSSAESAPRAGIIDGIYNCEGKRPDGATYRGIVHIVHHNGTYELLWTFSETEQHIGFGILTGDVLSVSYIGGELGVVAYRVEQTQQGPRLVGQWTVPEADGRVFAETLTRVSEDTVIAPPPAPNKPNRDGRPSEPNPSTTDPPRRRTPAPRMLRAA